MEINIFQTIGVSALAIFGYMTVWFFISLLRKRNDSADVAWGIGFVLAAIVPLVFHQPFSDRALLVTVLVAIWGIRLASHIYFRQRGKPEDYRYQKWREEWGKWFVVRSYVQVYILQGFLLLLIVSPVLVINTYQGFRFWWLDLFGVLVWLVGFFFEVVGDWQLSQFLKDPNNKGHLMRNGLWRYSRHPNYFGEVTQWWGIWIIALSVPFGWLTVIGPITITVLILFVSGVPLLEKKMKEHPEFEAYARQTSRFFPLLPKK